MEHNLSSIEHVIKAIRGNDKKVRVSFLIGKLLSDAKLLINDTPEFLAWCYKHAGLSHGSVYMIISVYADFKDEPEFNDVPWTTLRHLVGASRQVLNRALILKSIDQLDQFIAMAIMKDRVKRKAGVRTIKE